jgi:hypothetical protein
LSGLNSNRIIHIVGPVKLTICEPYISKSESELFNPPSLSDRLQELRVFLELASNLFYEWIEGIIRSITKNEDWYKLVKKYRND